MYTRQRTLHFPPLRLDLGDARWKPIAFGPFASSVAHRSLQQLSPLCSCLLWDWLHPDWLFTFDSRCLEEQIIIPALHSACAPALAITQSECVSSQDLLHCVRALVQRDPFRHGSSFDQNLFSWMEQWAQLAPVPALAVDRLNRSCLGFAHCDTDTGLRRTAAVCSKQAFLARSIDFECQPRGTPEDQCSRGGALW